ncbi:hypothetical protein MBLNU230_g6849t1 [Neophaeotheca triangularis]
MERTYQAARAFARPRSTTQTASNPQWTCSRCLHLQRQSRQTLHQRRQPNILSQTSRRHASDQPGDASGFRSIVDNPPTPLRANRKHNKLGLAILAAIPITSFFLGCWQVQRLGWKTDLIARFEDRLIRDPLPLPPQIDPTAVGEFDYRRVYARGILRHDQEMLIGPRLHDGKDGYLVITPLDRSAEYPDFPKSEATVLVNRGWISKEKAAQSARPTSLPTGPVTVQGLLRSPWKKNMFTPSNSPQQNIWHFPDVYEMAAHTGSQPVWIEATMPPDLLTAYDRESKGLPIGRPAEVNLRNNHAQYIATWFALSAATTVMMWMILRQPRSGTQGLRAGGRARRSREW